MTPTFEKKELFRNPKLVIRKSKHHGWGVFTTEDIEPMEVLEESPYFVVFDDEYKEDSYITTYSYGLHDDVNVIPLGFAGLYNHSPKANADSAFNEYHSFITHFATKKIKADSEIFIDYGIGDPINFTEPWPENDAELKEQGRLLDE